MKSLTESESKLATEIAARADLLLADLRLHVETPTGPGGGDGIEQTREILTGRLAALGADVESIPGDEKPEWLGLLSGGEGREPPSTSVCRRISGELARVLVAGHMDTVHPVTSEFKELSVSADGLSALGPGCVDMKGGIVIATHALEALEACGIPASWTFSLNADEETGTYHSEACLRAEAIRHDFGLALEPALPGGELAVERMGSGQFFVETTGKSAHVGRAFADGVSAVTKLAECLVEIATYPDQERGHIVSVGPIEGGAATNAVPERARAWGNVRFPDQAASDEIAAKLESLATGEGAMPAVAVRRSFNRPAKPLIPETESLALAARSAAEDLGQSLPFTKTGGVCDGNILQDAGLPTIDTLGVRGGGLHTTDEWIEIASLVERCQLLAILIARLCERGTD